MAKKNIKHRIKSKSIQKGEFYGKIYRAFQALFFKKRNASGYSVDATPTMAYIPLQLDLMSYETDKALNTGTLFPTLDKPFLGRRAK